MLVVDDDEAIRRMVAFAFELEGYDVASACDGIEAIVTAESFHPDVMVLDIMMPRMDGLTVLGHLRKQPATAAVPVVLLSAKADSADVAIGRRAGASDYITKPFETDDLLERARRAMREPVPVLASSGTSGGPVSLPVEPRPLTDEDRETFDAFIAPDPSVPQWNPQWTVIAAAVIAVVLVLVVVGFLLR